MTKMEEYFNGLITFNELIFRIQKVQMKELNGIIYSIFYMKGQVKLVM